MTIGDLIMRVLINDKAFDADLQKSAQKSGDKAGKTLGSKMTGGLKGAFKGGKGDILGLLGLGAGLGIATVGIGKLTTAVFKGVESLKRIEVINSQTAAAIESTGGAANVTAKKVEDMAGSMERLTGVEAETIQSGQNLLLTFTGIRNEAGAGNDIFDQTTRAMTDMAVAMAKGDGTAVDMQATAIQLGKALNDPITGLTALRKVGVAFTAGQKAQIKTMVEAGDVMGAQKVILAELNKEFGGSAEAFGKTDAGKFAKLGHAVGELEEALAKGLMPVLSDAADIMLEFAEATRKTGEAAADNQDPIQNLANLFHDLFKDADTPARTFLGGIVDGLNHVSQAANDLGSNLGDTIVFWDGYTDATEDTRRRNEALAESARESGRGLGVLEASAGKAKGAIADIGDETEEVAELTRTSTGNMRESWADYADRILGIARDAVGTAYQIIDDRAALSAANVETAELRKVIATGKATKEQKLRYQELGEEQATLLLDLAENGVKSGKAVTTATEQMRTRLKTAVGQEKKAIQLLLDALDKVGPNARDQYLAVSRLVALIRPLGLSSGPQERHSGGPVEAHTPYIVGKTGAEELFVPDTSGYIYPNVPSGMGSSGSAGTTNNITVNNPEPHAADADIGRMLRRVSALGIGR